MAVLIEKSSGRVIAGGLSSNESAIEIAKSAGINENGFKLEFSEQEIQRYRKKAYAQSCDHLFFDYMAAVAEYGEDSPQAIEAKNTWLSERNVVKTTYSN